jgi:hypothetical protein
MIKNKEENTKETIDIINANLIIFLIYTLFISQTKTKH